MISKKCSTCKNSFSIDEFHRNRSRVDGYHCVCRGCCKNFHKQIKIKYKNVHGCEYYKIMLKSDITKICPKCGENKHIKDFHKDRSNPDGFEGFCKICKNKLKVELSYKLRLEIITNYGGCCSGCGVSNPVLLCIDHVNNNGNEERKKIRSAITLYRKIINENYPPTYQLLCFNCNFLKKVNHEQSFCILGR